MKKWAAAGLLLAMVGAFFLYFNESVAFKIGDKERKVTPAARKQLVDSWISAGNMVAKKCNLMEALEVMAFVEKSSFMIIPRDADDTTAFGTAKNLPETEYAIGMIGLADSDRNLGDKWKEIAEMKLCSLWITFPDVNNCSFLFLKNERITEIWKGIEVINGGSQALVHSSRIIGTMADDDVRNAFYELAAYSLQGKILTALGGKEYETALKREMERLRNDIDAKKIVSPRYDLYQGEMERAFGEALSETEKRMRSDALWMDAMLKLFGEQSDASEKKLDFLIQIRSDSKAGLDI